ncbi:MAG: bifunctional glutamate N-acetyltransferase/amino-acid acetyltransferase ArgJ [Desulfobacteraceae bacterium]|nr:MAG: bifunctional glutamate N-acetyltransferase/amino-acid acetyltransferase ArgJ [Desulfobacteraceae bacterium]
MEDRDCWVQGFRGSAVASGLKKKGGQDLGLIVSEAEAVAAGVFTTSEVKAAPVLLCMDHLHDHRAKAILVNSGNANACTGSRGLADARRCAELVGSELKISSRDVLVASTGVIGAPLDMNAVSSSIPSLVKSLSPHALPRVVEAMMTTDSFPKKSLFQGNAGGKVFRMVGIAKGAGMIMPQMATMLCFVMTDLFIGAAELRRSLSRAVATTFNRISVDGDTSTNDTVLVLANGMAGNKELGSSELDHFQEALRAVLGDLAAMVVRDGEGATKLVRVVVRGAASAADAERAARTVAGSSLVKTAFYGADANWGRVMAALGRAGVRMEEEKISILIDDVAIVRGGLGVGPGAEALAQEKMKGKEFSLVIELGQGAFDDFILTCDLTHEYVSINANYRT